MMQPKNKNWLTVLFITLTALSPYIKSNLWRWWYNILARYDKDARLLLMNYGYADPTTPHMDLHPEDEHYRYPIQLYHYVIRGIDLANKNVLEVGSGRGGGASYIARYHRPHTMLGVDYSEANIAWCQRYFNVENLHFRGGRAEQLPCKNESMDIIINVESSHCYKDMAGFIREVIRVLRPGGYFSFCDLRTLQGANELKALFTASGLKIIDYHDISEHVLQALDLVHRERSAATAQKVPKLLRSSFGDFIGLKGTAVYKMLSKGEMIYVAYIMRKRET